MGKIAVVGSNMVDLITYTARMPGPGETIEAPRFDDVELLPTEEVTGGLRAALGARPAEEPRRRLPADRLQPLPHLRPGGPAGRLAPNGGRGTAGG